MKGKLATGFSRRSPILQSHGTDPLPIEAIRQTIPAVFAASKWDGCSENYSFIPTGEILQALQKENFQPFFACQARPRKVPEKFNFTKHMLRLRQPDSKNKENLHREVIIVGSSDRTSSLQIFAGYFSFVCMNQMVVGSVVGEVKLHHHKLTTPDVIEGVYSIVDRFDEADRAVTEMTGIELDQGARQEFVNQAAYHRFGNRLPFDPERLLVRRHQEQAAPTLWNDFNAVQEACLTGGIQYKTHRRMGSTRGLTNVGEVVAINRKLWDLAWSYAD